MWAAILQIVAFVLGFFRPKTTRAEAITKTANDMAETSATVARQNQTTTAKEIEHAEDQTAITVSGIDSADSLRDIALASQRAVNDANSQPGADD